MNSQSSAGAVRQPKWLVVFLSWLIPGYGFYVHGFRKRAIFFFVSLELTFFVGVALHGLVLFPVFDWTKEGFNVVSILTFLTQMCNGLLGIISVIPDLVVQFGQQNTDGTLSLARKVALFGYNETHHWADLGSFYLLISGGMNYFVLASTYDHFYGRKAAGRVAMEARQRAEKEQAAAPAGEAA